MSKLYIVVHETDQTDREDLDSFERGFLREDPGARSVQDGTWLVPSQAADAQHVLYNIIRHIRVARGETGLVRKLNATFYAARIDGNDRDGQLARFP